MTDDEFFTAIYLVCGSLPSKPEKQQMLTSMSTMYRRKLPNGQIQTWIVNDEVLDDYDRRVMYDPAFMDYYDRAGKLGVTMDQFLTFLAWAEAYEQRREKI